MNRPPHKTYAAVLLYPFYSRARTEVPSVSSVMRVTIRGAKYDVEDAALSNAFPLGVGNDFVGDVALSFRTGMAALLLCRRGED